MKVIFELDNTEEGDKIKRIVMVEEAYSLIWDIQQKIRNILNSEAVSVEKELTGIITDIYDSALMELYK